MDLKKHGGLFTSMRSLLLPKQLIMRSICFSKSHSSTINTLVLAMKLTPFILLLTCLQLSARAFSQRISFSGKNAPLERVFASIEKQTTYRFFYDYSIFENAQPVTLNIKNVTLEEMLDSCLKNQELRYKIAGKTIFIQKKTISPAPSALLLETASIDIKGKVTNEKGETVEGVTVKIKGTNSVTTTNEKGEFVLLKANDKAILQFSSINMEPFEISVKGETFLEVKLRTKITALGGVSVTINTGYQKVSKERMIGSYFHLDSASYHRRIGMDIINRIDGTVPGVLFDKKGSAGIQIRGVSTLQSSFNQPLIILDNFPFTGNLNNINPNDVESITVLKDAAAASVWGTLAGNGVIVITTKKGSFNQPLHLSLTSNATIQSKPDLFYYPRMSSSDFIDVEEYLFNQGYYDATLSNTVSFPVISPVVEVLENLRNGTISQSTADQLINGYRRLDLRNDLKNFVYKSSVSQQYYINLNGGTNMINYSISGGFNKSIPNIRSAKGNNQFTINSTTIFRPAKDLEFETGINLLRGKENISPFSLPNLYPYAQLRDAQGNPLAIPKDRQVAYVDTTGGGNLLDWHYRPLEEIGFIDNVRNTQFTRLNLKASYRFTNWLRAELRYQYTNQTVDQKNNQSLQSYFARDLINRFTQIDGTNITQIIPLGGILDISNSSSIAQNARAQINIIKTWNGVHDLSAFVAGEITETKSESNNTRFYGYNSETGSYSSNLNYGTYYPQYGSNSSSTIPDVNSIQSGVLNRIVSVIANSSYTYKGRYMLYGSARRDGSNIFGVNTNNKWKPLWSIGAGWDIFKEPFYKITWLSNLRLRTSFGYMGNINNTLSGMPTILYTGAAQYTNLPKAQVGNAPNPDLKWEQVQTLNIGLNFSLIRDRIMGSLDWFHKRSTDLISNIPFDPTSGVDQYTVNSASLKGNGFELNIRSINTNGAIKWETGLGLSYAKMIVTKLYDGRYKASDFVNYFINAYVGKTAYGMYSYRWSGLDPTNGDPQGNLNKTASKDYVSILNDSIQNQKFNGSTIPLYSGFINNSLNWKNLTLSFNITYKFSYYFRKPTISYTDLFLWTNLNADYSRRWKSPGDEAKTSVPSLSYPADNYRDEFYQNSEVNVLRGDNIRIQDAQLQYTLTKKEWKSSPFTSAQFIFYMNNINIILWRKNKFGMDPDYTYGSQYTTAPTPRSWALGLNVNF